MRRKNGCQNPQSLDGGHIHLGHPGRDPGLPCDHVHERLGEGGVIAHELGAGAGVGAGPQETELSAEAPAGVGVGVGEEAGVGVVVGVLSRVPR